MTTLGWIALGLVLAVALVAFATRRSETSRPQAGQGDAARRQIPARDLWKLARSGDAIERAAAALRAGDELEAVRIARDAGGLGLPEAKRVVDELRAQLGAGGPLAKLLDIGAPPPSAASPDLEAVHAAVREGRMVEAVKLHRERTGAGLAESKEAVDRIAASLGK